MTVVGFVAGVDDKEDDKQVGTQTSGIGYYR
jgi:hypothetical protein